MSTHTKKTKNKRIVISIIALTPLSLYASPYVVVDGVNHGDTYTSPSTYISENGNVAVGNGGVYKQEGGVFVGQNKTTLQTKSNVSVDGDKSTLNVVGNLFLGNSDVGKSSDNIMNITNGGEAYIDGLVSLARKDNDSAVITVDGHNSTLRMTNNLTGAVNVGDQGHGQLIVKNGGAVDADNMTIANNNLSTGTLRVEGEKSQVNLEDLVIGSAGNGQLVLTDDANLNVGKGTGTVYIAERVGSTGKLSIGYGGLAGQLDAQSIGFGLGAGTLQFDFTNPQLQFGERVRGKGTIVKLGDGTLDLNGDNSYFSGTTYVNQGLISVNENTNSRLGGDVVIGKNGSLKGDTNSILGNIEDQGVLIFEQASNDAFSQKISGAGTLIKEGNGILMIVGHNDLFTGVTKVNDGTLQIGDLQGNGEMGGEFRIEKNSTLQGSTRSISGDIYNDGEMIFQQNSDGIYDKNISGTGEVDKIGNGLLTLSGDNSHFQGDTIIEKGGVKIKGQGTLGGRIEVFNGATFEANANSIRGNISTDGLVTFEQEDDAFYSQALSGAGGVMKKGQGRLTLTGDNSKFQGILAVSEGTLALSSEKGMGGVGGTVNALENTVLEGDGTVTGDVNVYQKAEHKPGLNGTGKQIIKGNYTNYGSLTETGTVDSVNNLTVYGKVDVTNAILNLDFTPQNKNAWEEISKPFTLIDNKGNSKIIGEFSRLNNGLLFLSPQLDYEGGDGNDLTMIYTRNDKDFSEYASAKAKSLADAINYLPGNNPIWQGIALAYDQNELKNRLNKLSGEIHPSVQSALIDNSHYISDAMNNRLRDLSSHRISEFSFSNFTSDMDSDNTAQIWSQGYGSWNKAKETVDTAQQNMKAQGIFLGMDVPKEYGRLGLLVGYGSTNIKQSTNTSSGDITTYYAGIYGGHQWDSLSISTGISAGWHNIKTTRNVRLDSYSDTSSSDYKAKTAQAFSEFAYKLKFQNVGVEPFVNASYVYEQMDAFDESGHESALLGRGNNQGIPISTIGIRGSDSFNIISLQVNTSGSFGWQHQFSDSASKSVLSFKDGSEGFKVQGTPTMADALKIESGVSVNISNATSASISYKGMISDSALDNIIGGSVQVKF